MPSNRKKARRPRKRSNRSNAMTSDPVARANIRLFIAGSTASGTSQVITSLEMKLANLGDRGIQFATMYQIWRPKKIVLFQYCLQNTSQTNDLVAEHALAWSPEPASTLTSTPSSFAQIIDFPSSRIDAATRPIKFVISGNQLMSSRTTKWLYTNVTGTTTAETSAGCLFTGISSAGGDTNSSTHIVAYLNIELKEPVDTNVSLSYNGYSIPRLLPVLGIQNSSSSSSSSSTVATTVSSSVSSFFPGLFSSPEAKRA